MGEGEERGRFPEIAESDTSSMMSQSVNDGSVGVFLPGAASLLEEIDKRILIILRDGRHLVGTLRSFDQYMNLILEGTCERSFANGKLSYFQNFIILFGFR